MPEGYGDCPQMDTIAGTIRVGRGRAGVRMMNARELKKIAAKGEDSRTQFKADIDSPDALAAEIVSFLNMGRGSTKGQKGERSAWGAEVA